MIVAVIALVLLGVVAVLPTMTTRVRRESWAPPATQLVLLAGRGHPELRDAKVSEQFIIGTFASVLWAAGCAGVVIALVG